MPPEDMEIISGIFATPVISVDFGKLERIGLDPITPDYILAVLPERGTTNRILAWNLKEHRGTLTA
jgi:hypothetical protein